MATEPVVLEIDNGVCRLTLNHPESGNALGEHLGQALLQAVDSLRDREEIRVILLTGTGNTFCVGGDIKNSLSRFETLPEDIDRSLTSLHPMIMTLATLPVPVVSALNGSLGGGGIGLALSADLVVSTESTKLRGGYSGIGLTPDLGTSWFLKRRAGAARAKRILFLNESLPAQVCYDWGVFDAVYPDAAFGDEVEVLVHQLATGPASSLSKIKALVDEADRDDLQEQLNREREVMVAAARGEEVREGVSAFLEKRTPLFTG